MSIILYSIHKPKGVYANMHLKLSKSTSEYIRVLPVELKILIIRCTINVILNNNNAILIAK